MLFLLVLALTGCLSEEIPTEKETTLVRVGEEAPHFTVGMLDDTAITLSDLQGNVVLLTFFSTWCPTCRKQMQQMQTQIVDRFASFQSIEAKRSRPFKSSAASWESHSP